MSSDFGSLASWQIMGHNIALSMCGRVRDENQLPVGFLFKGAEDRLPRPAIHTHYTYSSPPPAPQHGTPQALLLLLCD